MPHLIETKQALSNPEDDMPRNLYGADHEAFRKTARELVERSLKPRDEQFIEARVIDREAWTEAGKQGLLGLEVPEVYGGSEAGDYRFNAVLGEELSKFNAAASSCFGATPTAWRHTWWIWAPVNRRNAGYPAPAPARSSRPSQ